MLEKPTGYSVCFRAFFDGANSIIHFFISHLFLSNTRCLNLMDNSSKFVVFVLPVASAQKTYILDFLIGV